MKNKNILLVAFITLTCFTSLFVNAQTSEPVSPFKVTADLVSSYVWRGSLATASPTPNFQPTLAYTKGNFEIGAQLPGEVTLALDAHGLAQDT